MPEITLNFGDTIRHNGMDFVLLDMLLGGDYLCVTKQKWTNDRFDAKRYTEATNNFANCTLRRKMDDFVDQLDRRLLIPMTVDLIADNGDKSYGTITSLAAPLSCDQIRQYRDILPTWGESVWTVTPWYCGEPGGARYVRVLDSDRNFYSDCAYSSYGVAPACVFSSEHLKLRREAQIIIAEYSDEIVDDDTVPDDTGDLLSEFMFGARR